MSFTLLVAVLLQLPDTQVLARSLADLRTHPVEVVAKDTVPTVVRGHALLDIDADGQPEVFLAIAPKYRQTATVVIYRAAAKDRVERFYEGLAPGPLMRVSGRQVDTHTLGNGIDMSIEGGADTARLTRVLAAARAQGMQIVQYPEFFHVDQRSRAAAYVDLARAVPPVEHKTCESFEFSPVEGLVAGHVGTDRLTAYLVVLTPTDIVFYRFRGVTSDGRLEKAMWMVARPRGLTALQVTQHGVVVGLASTGDRIPLVLPR